MELVFGLALGAAAFVCATAYRQHHRPYRGLQWRIYQDGNGAYALQYRPFMRWWDFPTLEQHLWHPATEGAGPNLRYATLAEVLHAIAHYEEQIAREHNTHTWRLIGEKLPSQRLSMEALRGKPDQ